jgi:ABC-type uncharacterized transport system fused permease/ATPase subunit
MGGVEDIIEQANAYLMLVINKDNAHYRMAQRYARFHKLLGVPAVMVSAIVSTAVFSTLQSSTATALTVLTGTLALLAAVLTALQTFFNYSDLATQHRSTAQKYSDLRRRIEQFRLRQHDASTNRTAALDELGDLSLQLSDIEASEPQILPRVYDAVRGQYYPSWLRSKPSESTDIGQN